MNSKKNKMLSNISVFGIFGWGATFGWTLYWGSFLPLLLGIGRDFGIMVFVSVFWNFLIIFTQILVRLERNGRIAAFLIFSGIEQLLSTVVLWFAMGPELGFLFKIFIIAASAFILLSLQGIRWWHYRRLYLAESEKKSQAKKEDIKK